MTEQVSGELLRMESWTDTGLDEPIYAGADFMVEVLNGECGQITLEVENRKDEREVVKVLRQTAVRRSLPVIDIDLSAGKEYPWSDAWCRFMGLKSRRGVMIVRGVGAREQEEWGRDGAGPMGASKPLFSEEAEIIRENWLEEAEKTGGGLGIIVINCKK